MRFLFVMDPLARINVAGDSTYMLMRACSGRGFHVAWCTPDDLYVEQGQSHARVQEVAGVKTRSIGEGSLKKVEIYKDGDAAGEE